MNTFPLLILHTVSLLTALLVNYLSNMAVFNSNTIGEVSRKYDTLFAPSGYAFSIWGLIYPLLIVFQIYEWYSWLKENKNATIRKVSIWFALANFANAVWVIAWVYEYMGLSVVIILILLFSLIQLIRILNMERWDAPLSIIACVWWPICLYSGWIIIATVANVSAFLLSIGWKGEPLPASVWTIIMILISTLIYVFLIYKRNMREAALVGVWGLAAIAYKQWGEYKGIVIVALSGAILLFIYACYHAYKNRATSPVRKWMGK